MSPLSLGDATNPIMPRGSETVLIAEDNVAVRRVLSFRLKRYGYTVLEAVDPLEAERVALE